MSVRVVCGANSQHFPLAGRNVAYVAKVLQDVVNVPPTAFPWVNGQEVGMDYLLCDGDLLEFSRRFGRKGGIHDFWSESEFLELVGGENLALMREAGLAVSPHPVLTSEQVRMWTQWLADRTQVSKKTVGASVSIDNEVLTFDGKHFQFDRVLCLILDVLLKAKGEIRSTGDIKLAYPHEPWEERLDLTIKRKLIPHISGVGSLIESVHKKGYRMKLE